VRGFVRPASDGDRVRGDQLKTGSGNTEMVVKSEVKSFVDADTAGTEILRSERCGDELGGAFVLLPNENVEGVAHQFAHASFFEGGRDQKRLAGAGDDDGEKPFARAPTNAGEVVERSAGAEEDGVEFWVQLGHEFAGAKKTGVKFVGGDGMNAIAERFESGEGRWQLGLWGR
jgi:hypothetical protein